MLQQTTLKFLGDLKKNNNKEWFEKNRKVYEAAKEDFSGLVQNVIDRFAKKDETIATLKAKDCVFRINRDVRFSKDKSPYKSNMGASFGKGGKKSMLAGYYFHCEPGNSFVGGGLWNPEAEKIKKVRQEIDYNFDEFKKIFKGEKLIREYGGLNKNAETSLSREPKGYEKDNPAIDYIKLKSWVAMKPLADADLRNKDLVNTIVASFDALKPVIDFLNRGLEN